MLHPSEWPWPFQDPAVCCWKHAEERDIEVRGMVLCPTCGNKRCPKASDCSLACTNSNDVGQPGSRYTLPKDNL